MTIAEDVQTELDRAQLARDNENLGRMRVCCRRAAGAAIRRWLSHQAEPPAWGQMAITQLRFLANADERVPAAVRRAAGRLSTTVSEDHTLPFSEDPIDDALIIIEHFAV